MSIDHSLLNLASNTAALKLALEGSGTGTIPATGAPTSEYSRITIPHGLGTDELIFRVLVVVPGYGAYSNYFVVPFVVSGLFATPAVDATNLYLEVGQSGSGLPAQNFSYYYRVLIP